MPNPSPERISTGVALGPKVQVHALPRSPSAASVDPLSSSVRANVGPFGQATLSLRNSATGREGLAGLSDEVRPSGNVGIGWQWTLARNVALRTELRGHVSLFDPSGGLNIVWK